MRRAVFSVDCVLSAEDPSDMTTFLTIEEPLDAPDAEKKYRFSYCLTEAPLALLDGVPGPGEQDRVQRAGQEVYRLACCHPGVKHAIDAAVAGDATYPIFVSSVDPAEAFPWEALYHPGSGFLALQDRWPIARLAGRATVGEVEHRVIAPPLSVVAVIAAAERDGRPEWLAIQQVLETPPLDCALTVLVADEALRDEIAAAAPAAPAVAVTVDFVPDTVAGLVERVRAAKPHVVHFFCHGTSKYETPYLEVANLATALGGEPLYVGQADLATLAGDALIVALNACEGAQPARNAHSLASGLCRKRVPAAIGMRASIDYKDAHAFTRAFLRKAVQTVASLPEDVETELDWAQVMPEPRHAIAGREGAPPAERARATRTWTLPVLFLRRAPLHVRRLRPDVSNAVSAAHERLVGELDVLTTMRARLAAELPGDKLDLLDARIADVRAQLGEGMTTELGT